MDSQLTSLGNGNHIVAHSDGRQAIALDRGRDLVSTHLDVLEHHWMQASILELLDRLDTNWAFLEQLQVRNANRILLAMTTSITRTPLLTL